MRLYFRDKRTSDEALLLMSEDKTKRKIETTELALEYVSVLIPRKLQNKTVVIRGAGENTAELLKLWDGKVDIKAIVVKENKRIGGKYEFIELQEAVNRKYDCIVIASKSTARRC